MGIPVALRRNSWEDLGQSRCKENRGEPRPLEWTLSWTPLCDVLWEFPWGVLEGLKTEKSTLMGALVGALVGAFVAPLMELLVGPLVGQILLSPGLCAAHGRDLGETPGSSGMV